VLSINWEAGTKAENEPQTEVLMAHLFKLKRRFAIVTVVPAPQGPTLAQAVAERVAKETGAEYGKDWVNWGMQIGGGAWMQSVAQNVPSALSNKDWRSTPLADLPAMDGIKTFRDHVGLIVDITPSGTLARWVALVSQPHNVPMGFACTAVMGPEAYPLLDSGQIVGIMSGMAGASQYYQQLGRKGFVTLGMTAQAMAHLLILVLIALGNVGYFAGRRAA
jgi:hypothetical protein